MTAKPKYANTVLVQTQHEEISQPLEKQPKILQ